MPIDCNRGGLLIKCEGRASKRVKLIAIRFTFHWLLVSPDMTIEAKLIVVEGATEAEIRLKLPTIIGRSGEASLKVRTSVVSREHCRLYEKDGALYVEDLNSSNGTFVNEEKITAITPIATGDFLTVGPVTLEVVCEKDDRSISHDPYSGDQSVLTESPVPDAESASNVHYQETIEGSFLGINDSVPLKSGAEKKRENLDSPERDPIQFKVSKQAREPKSEQVDAENGSRNNDGKGKAEQSNALDDFLKNLNE